MSDVEFSVNEKTFKAVFNKALPKIPHIPFDGETTVGLIWFGLEGTTHLLKAGDVSFESVNRFRLTELDLGWDKLILRFGIDVPPIEIGGFCLVRVPEDSWFLPGECLVPFPRITVFTSAPEIGPLTLNLKPITPYLVTEISGRFAISIRKVVSGGKSYQGVFAEPKTLDVDPISVNDTFGKLPGIVKGAIIAATPQLFAYVPQAWMIDVALSVLGFPTVTAYLMDLLDIHDDFEEWLMEVMNINIGVHNILKYLIFQELLESEALFRIDDPYPFVKAGTIDVADYGGFPVPPPAATVQRPAVTASIVNPSVGFDDDQMFVRFDLGG